MELCCIWDNMYILVLVISLLLFWLTYLYFVENYGYWEQLKIPHVQAVFPWGSMSDGLIFTKVHLAIACDEFYKQFEGKQYYGIMQVRSPCLVIRDPDLIQSILTIDSDSFRDRASVEYNYKEYMLKNIFTMRGDEWKIRRKKLMPAYNSAQIKIFCHLDTSTENLKNHMEEMVQRSEEVDVEDLVSPFILETVINCAFSADSENYPSEIAELRQTVPLLFQLDLSILQKLFMYNAFPVFKRIYWKKFDLVKPSIKELMTNLVCKIITNREENDLARYDFLELLIKLRQSKICIEKDEVPINKAGNDECLTNHEMAGEVFGFIYGSYQKPLSVMIFCLYQLSVNLLVQEQLCREVKEVMNKCSGVLQAQALEQMTYMDRVIKETMRMYPPMPILQRTCNQDYKVPNSDLVIKEDVKIIIPTYSLHHDPQHFPDPIRFIPDRFTDEYASERHPFVFLPLGAGPRNCVDMITMNRIIRQLYLQTAQVRYCNYSSKLEDKYTPKSNPGVYRRLKVISKDEPDIEKAEIDYDSIEDLEQDFMQADDMHDEVIDHMKRISKAKQFKITERRHFKPPKEPSMLTWSEKQQIKYLNLRDPEKWTPESLAEGFPASPNIIKKILNSNWKPANAARLKAHDHKVSENWKAFHKGQLQVNDLQLKAHLAKFIDRKDGIELLSDEEAAKLTEVIHPEPKHKEFVSLIKTLKPEDHSKASENQQGTIQKNLIGEKENNSLSPTKILEDPRVHYTLDQYCKRLEVVVNTMTDTPNDLKPILKNKVDVKERPSVSDIYVAPSERFKTNAIVFQKTKKSPLQLRDPDNLPYRIRIPKEAWKQGSKYRVNDSFYNDKGQFLYRVPGLKFCN